MRRDLLVAAASGALLSLALPPNNWWPLLFALTPLFTLVALAPRNRRAFWLGFAFGLPFFTLYILWLPASFAQPDFFGPFFWLLFPPLVLLLSAFWGLVTLLARLLGGGCARPAVLSARLWLLWECARAQGYFAFPWGTIGYGWLDSPVAQLADTFGVWGLGLLTAGVAALFAVPFLSLGRSGRYVSVAPGVEPPRRPGPLLRFAPPLAGLLLLVGAWAWGSQKLQWELPEPTEVAVLVQPNIDPFGRVPGQGSDFNVLSELTAAGVDNAASDPDLVVWPEGDLIEGREGQAMVDEIQELAPEASFLIGARMRDGDGRSYNSALTIAGGEVIDRYDKYYLVPFGERFPLIETAEPLYRAVFGLFGLPVLEGTFPGESFEPLESPEGLQCAYICYESVFSQVQRQMVRDGATVLLNITNDAWFARGNGARQHYEMGSMRAIEARRYILRSGIDGITGGVDPLGRPLHEMPRGIPGFVVAQFAHLDVETPYVRYGHLLLPLLLGWVLLGWAAGFAGRRRRVSAA